MEIIKGPLSCYFQSPLSKEMNTIFVVALFALIFCIYGLSPEVLLRIIDAIKTYPVENFPTPFILINLGSFLNVFRRVSSIHFFHLMYRAMTQLLCPF